MKKIILSLSIIAAAAAIVIGATSSFFSDTETSTGNIFTAGTLDLKVDHKFASYNGNDCGQQCVPGPTNLVQSDGFEVPEVTDNSNKWQIFPSPVGGWTVEWFGGFTPFGGLDRPEPANLEYHEGVLGNAYQGDQYVELDTDWFGPASTQSGEPASVRIYQDIITVPGKKYQLKFAFAPRPNTPAAENALEVKWDGATVQNILPTAGGPGAIAWTLYTIDVTASDASSRLEFIDKGTPNSLGTFIDAIQLYEYSCTYQITGGTCTLWDEKDLGQGDYFWNFGDVKPGDYGKNVISLRVYDNDAWGCLLVGDTQDNENDLIDPEEEAGDTLPEGIGHGELSQFLKAFVWSDNNHNGIYEPGAGETQLLPPNTPLIDTELLQLSLTSVNPIYVGVAWCAGEQSVDQQTGVISCDGAGNQNVAQTDSFIASLTAYAEQKRNNPSFSCANLNLPPRP